MLRYGWIAMLLVSTISLSLLADEKSEWKSLTGSWVIEKAEMDGDDITMIMKSFVLKLEEGKYVLDDNGKLDKGTLKLNLAKTPKQIDVTGGPESPFKGKTFPCIYEFRADKLVICYGMDFKTRPTEFQSPRDGKRLLVVYKKKS